MLRQMRERIRTRQYVMTLHAEEEMDDDGFTIFDVERVILSGHITERQADQQTGEWKYVLVGKSLQHIAVGVVAKLSPTGKLVIITVYRES
jgi:hypothetical protein